MASIILGQAGLSTTSRLKKCSSKPKSVMLVVLNARFAKAVSLIAVAMLAACGDGDLPSADGGSGSGSTADFSNFDSQISTGGAKDGGSTGLSDGTASDLGADSVAKLDGTSTDGPKDAAADAAKDAAKDTAKDTGKDVAVDSGVEPDVGTPGVCGDSSCDVGETWANCAQDCPAPPDVCGDKLCTPGENQVGCPIDCDPDFAGVVQCLANKCAALLQTCLAEPQCVTILGNGVPCLANCMEEACLQTCIDSQNFNASAKQLASCGFKACAKAAPGTICGNSQCESGENSLTCAADCQTSTPKAQCADGTCDGGESAKTCPMDCDAKGKVAWECGKQKCPKETEDCKSDPACIPILVQAGDCIEKCGGGDKCAEQCSGPVVGNSAALALAICGLQSCQ